MSKEFTSPEGAMIPLESALPENKIEHELGVIYLIYYLAEPNT